MQVTTYFTPATTFRWVVTVAILVALLLRSWVCGAAVAALCAYGVIRFDGYSDKVVEGRRFRSEPIVTGRWRFLVNGLLHGDLAALVVVAFILRAPALGLFCIAAVVAMLIALLVKEKVLTGASRSWWAACSAPLQGSDW
jgi:hypothetical protein